MSDDDKRLSGKRSLIVGGGGGGNGRAITCAFGRAGALVAVADIDQERADEAAEELSTAGGKAVGLAGDVKSQADLEAMVQDTIDAFGGLDVLVTVVGGMNVFAPWSLLHEAKDEDWDLIFDVNLRYVPRVLKPALRQFLEQGNGGTIVGVGSIAGQMGSPVMAAYGAAKAGLVSLTKSVAAEYGPDRIRMNLVTCGMIETPAGRSKRVGGEFDAIPMLRPGEPEEVAEAAVFLASDASAYITGQSLVIDGGVMSRGPFELPTTDPFATK